ncbi:hypothetical protein PT277_05005 [Acetobacteraceae bacterium ESL0709]|nr:hypothetical protein [Acetobacteraceae bacterium ESL0697]MDF7678053.1 hypothetical protein [Acetobacteraceae bacterium ESL0709]
MTFYLCLAVAIIAATLTALTLFAWRSGRNAAQAKAEHKDSLEAQDHSKAIEAIAEAQSHAAHSENELIARLEAGKEGL